MGANFDLIRFKPAKSETPAQAAEALMEAERMEYGHGAYQGHLGIKPGVQRHPQVFESLEAAESFSIENNDKWGPADLMALPDGWYLLSGWCPS